MLRLVRLFSAKTDKALLNQSLKLYERLNLSNGNVFSFSTLLSSCACSWSPFVLSPLSSSSSSRCSIAILFSLFHLIFFHFNFKYASSDVTALRETVTSLNKLYHTDGKSIV